MASKYLGFDLQQMLGFLRSYCKEVLIETESDGWRVYVRKDNNEELETKGHGLFYGVSRAFKPFAQRAREDVARAKKQLKPYL